MDLNIISMVLLFYTFVAFVTTTAADENGYLVSEFPDIECNDPSTAIPECSGFLDYKIANLSPLVPNVTGLYAEMRQSLPTIFLYYIHHQEIAVIVQRSTFVNQRTHFVVWTNIMALISPQ